MKIDLEREMKIRSLVEALQEASRKQGFYGMDYDFREFAKNIIFKNEEKKKNEVE